MGALCTRIAKLQEQTKTLSPVSFSRFNKNPRFEWWRVRLIPFVCVGLIEMIVNTTRITFQPEKRTEFLQTIGPLVEPIKSAKGCRDFGFYLDTADENSTLLVSEWETETD